MKELKKSKPSYTEVEKSSREVREREQGTSRARKCQERKLKRHPCTTVYLRLPIDPTSGGWLLLLSGWAAVSGTGLSGRGGGGVGVASSIRTLLEDSWDCCSEST